jgi:putative cell wall-binding protein
MSRTKKIAVLAIIAMVLTLMPAAMFAATADSTRLSGAGRVETALDIASAGTWGTSVVLAPADQANLVDALAAAPLAGQENAPILLTFKGSLDAAVKAKIAALGATKVYVVGAISDAVAAEVDAMTGVTVETLKGAGRQATAAAINAKLTSPAGTFVVGYDAIADALSVASYAAKNKFAIVLANQDGSVASASLVGATKYIVGGTAKVDDITGVTRISGADRFATNSAVASTLSFSYDRVYVANGVSCVDALAVAPLAAKYNSFVALASGSDVAAASVINAKLIASSKVIAVGGTSAVSDAVKAKVYASTVLSVKSATALNATQVQVVFTQAVDKTDAQTAAQYAIGVNNPATAVLGTDKVTVTLTFAAAASVEVTDAILVVNAIKSASDATVLSPKYTQVFTYKDEVKPTISKVVSSTNSSYASSVTVTASEPIATSLVKIDGVYKTIDFAGTNKATITGLSLDKSTTHTIDLINLTDKATVANITVLASQTFSITTDTAAPTVTLKANSDKQIYLTFSKSMDVASLTTALAANTNVKDEAFADVNHNVAAVVANTDNKEFTVDITAALYTNTSTRTLTVVLPNTVKDSLGNAIATSTVQVVMTKDTVKPVATGYKIIKDTTGKVTDIEIAFSEGLLNNANPAEPTIVDANGVLTTFVGLAADAITVGDKKVTYSLTAAKYSGVYNFSFPAELVSDQAETANKSAAFSYSIDFGAASGTFNVTSAEVLVAGSNIITVTYPVAVKGGAVANSATDLASYSLAGKPLAAGTTITLSGDQKVATITLPADGVATTDATAVFTVVNVKSLTGDTVNAFTGTVSVKDNTAPVLTSAVLNSNGSITLGFSEKVNVATVVGDYTIRLNNKIVNDAQVTAIVAGAGSEDGKYIIPNFVATYTAGAVAAGDEAVYIDCDNDGAYTASADILLQYGTIANISASNYASGVVGGKDAAISTITIVTDAASAGKDAVGGNSILAGTSITVK